MARLNPNAHVRRQTLTERLESWTPSNWLLWFTEQVNSHDWDRFDQQWSALIAVSLNAVFIFARINSSPPSDGSDLFDDYNHSLGGWWAWLSSFVVHLLALFSLVNAWYTFWRSRSYRLYHQDANLAPRTPSARRVPVHDSPIMQNPLHLLPSFLSRLTKPQPGNGGQMVWEIAVWDPFPVCLRVFVFFSPLHVLVIAMFLPYSSLDPRPSMTVIKTLLLCAVVSTQGYFLQTYFEQKYRDQAIISQQVGKEYDAKFVQPNVRRAPVRDVAVQYPTTPKWDGSKWNTPAEVMVSPRNYFSPRTFDTHPSLAYESQCHQSQPDSTLQPIRPSPAPTPYITAEASTGPSVADLSSPIRTAQHNKRQASPTKPQWPHQGLGDGGNLGVYSSAYSPLRKAASSNVLRGQMKESRARDGSPLKRSSVPAGGPFASRLKPGDGPGSRRESGYY